MHHESAVSIRIDPQIKAVMSLHEDVNWSGVVRNAIKKKLHELEAPPIDQQRAKKALEYAAQLRKMKPVSSKSAAEIIREWREKRK